MEDNTDEIKKYRKDKSLKLIDKYKDLIYKTFAVADKDLLQGQIDDDEDETQKEAKLLEALKKRRIALDEVNIMLDKIESLERHIKSEDGEALEPIITQSFVKRNAKKQ